METRKMKLALSAGALALSLALAGCGGGGTAAVMEEEAAPPPPTPTDASGMIAGLSADAQKQILTALDKQNDGNSTTRRVAAGATTEIGGIVFTCASAYACEITAENSAGDLIVSWTSMEVPDSAAMVTSNDPTMRDLQVGNYFDAVKDAIRRDDNDQDKLYRGAAKTTVKYDGNDLVIELGGALDRDGDGTGMTLAKNVADPNNPPMVKNNLPGRPQPEWHENRLQKTWDDDHMTDAIVYTNREPDMTQPFEDKYDQNMIMVPGVTGNNNRGVILNPDPAVVAVTKGHVDPVGMVDAGTNADSPDDDKWVPNPLVKFNFSRSSTPNAVTRFGGGTDVDERNSVRGTYDGAMGTYYCASDNCYLNAKGEPVNMEGMMFGATDTVPTWSFVPDVGAVITTTKEWLAFGVWVTWPTEVGNSHRMGHILAGSNPYNAAMHGMPGEMAADRIDYLQGKAEYAGDAAGYYTHELGHNKYSGEFTADAMLSADFGDADEPGMISGRIRNFKSDEEGHDFIKSWAVTLEESPLNAGGTPGMLMGETSGAGGQSDGRTGWSGEWTGNLYGFKPYDEDNDLSNIRGEHLPEGVAGEFYAEHTDLTPSEVSHGMSNVTGAFGAMKE